MSSLDWLAVVARHLPERNRRQLAQLLEFACLGIGSRPVNRYAPLTMPDLVHVLGAIARTLPRPDGPEPAGDRAELVLEVLEQMARPRKGHRHG